ncbi:proline-rich Akt substrate 40 kDa isoform X2 [Anticarsia gemmatalis]|uniref:proline-rich Akt substrate 40 kDa isoform X2 n=1 Tax=Anticarsia gemmatalis TaxID=129554 RepID=UPI003F75B114
MALCVCKCLNVTLEGEKLEDNVDIGKLELTSMEQRDIFFSEKLMSCSVNSLKKQVAQPALVEQHTVGRWTIHSCLACGQPTHAISHDKNGPYALLVCKANQTTQERINNLKKSNNYSPVFNLLVPEATNDIEMKENVDTNNFLNNDKNIWLPTQQVIGTLSKQLNQTLESKLEAVEETVRQFRDQKYAEFEAYRERAQRDHKILASIISKARNNAERESWRTDAALDNGPPSPQLPPLQRRRLSSFKDAKKLQQIIKPNRHMPSEEDSLDAEELFDLEGMDSRHNMLSDQDDYDSDQGSNDEGIHISRPRGGGVEVIARSLPMNMPKFPNERPTQREYDDDEEPQDIAASIKALARSVHGDVFELPRPRFSTQI